MGAIPAVRLYHTKYRELPPREFETTTTMKQAVVCMLTVLKMFGVIDVFLRNKNKTQKHD